MLAVEMTRPKAALLMFWTASSWPWVAPRAKLGVLERLKTSARIWTEWRSRMVMDLRSAKS